MSLFPTTTITIQRYSPDLAIDAITGGQYLRGKWVPRTEPLNEFDIQVSRQPLNGEEMATFAEGQRVKVAYKYYSDVEIYTTDPVKGRYRDVIIDHNEVMEVVHVEPWQNGIISHFMVIAIRKKETE